MKTESEVRAALESIERTIWQGGIYRPEGVAAFVERAKALRWVLGELEL